MSSSIVLIGPAEAIPALRERLSSGAELQTFTDAQTLEALDHIMRVKPAIVALEHEFSTSSRGTALIDRIKDDPALRMCEIRVIAYDGALSRIAKRGAAARTAALGVDDPSRRLDARGTRRASRIRMKEDVDVLIDGNVAMLVDMSPLGVQVLSPKMLKPNQRVRMAFSDGKGIIRCTGSIAWASFEMPKGQPPRYRAGIELMGADVEALRAYIERHKEMA